MTIQISWWMWCIFLFLIPFIYGYFRKSGGDFDFAFDLIFVVFGSWGISAGILIAKLFFT